MKIHLVSLYLVLVKVFIVAMDVGYCQSRNVGSVLMSLCLQCNLRLFSESECALQCLSVTKMRRDASVQRETEKERQCASMARVGYSEEWKKTMRLVATCPVVKRRLEEKIQNTYLLHFNRKIV